MTKPNGKGNWRTFKSREEVWAFIVPDGCYKARGLDCVPGDVLVDEPSESQLLRRREFYDAYVREGFEQSEEGLRLIDPTGTTVTVIPLLPKPVNSTWTVWAKEHTIRIKPAAEGLYTDLFHLERDGVLVIDQTDEGEKPHVFRQAEIDAELAEGRYEEVKE